MAEQLTIAVIGGGIAGLVAAREAAAAGATVWHVMGQEVMGGLVANVGALENFSGGDVAGIDLATTLFSDASELGVMAMMEDATAIVPADGTFVIQVGEEELHADKVIFATGARLRRLDVRGASEFEDLGLSYCGWCDGPLHKGKPVVVIGGGDSALQEARHLATLASEVTIVARGETLKARPEFIEAATALPNVTIKLATDVREIVGEINVTGVRVLDRASGAETTIPCAGVFAFIGLEPWTYGLPEGIVIATDGTVITHERLETSIPGLYAIGAVRCGYSGRLDDAIDEARRAVAHITGALS